MTRMLWVAATGLLALATAERAAGQSSSLYRRSLEHRAVQQSAHRALPPTPSRYEEAHTPLNPELEAASQISVKTPPPNRFEINDLLGVIVREQKDYRSDSTAKTESEYEVRSDVDEFLKFISGHLGAATFGDGRPNIGYSWDTEFDGKGDTERKDSLTFRITVRVIDIKPNGQLVLSGKKRIRFDEDVQTMTITGVCRASDVTPDNTVLSSQIYNQVIEVEHHGPMRDASERGWLIKLVDWLGPF